jgi:hypothetical protein
MTDERWRYDGLLVVHLQTTAQDQIVSIRHVRLTGGNQSATVTSSAAATAPPV